MAFDPSQQPATPASPMYPGQPVAAAPLPPAPKKKSFFARHKFLTVVLGLIVLGIVIGMATSGGGDEPGPAAAGGASADATDPAVPADPEAPPEPEAPAEPEKPAEPEAPAAPGIGTPVRDGKFEFTVTSVEPGVAQVGDDMFGQKAQGQYVLVHMTVANIGDEAQLFDSSSQKAFDTQKREFSADGGAAIYLPDSNSFLNEINPGNSVEGVVIFDVPADASLATLEVHDSFLSGGATIALQ